MPKIAWTRSMSIAVLTLSLTGCVTAASESSIPPSNPAPRIEFHVPEYSQAERDRLADELESLGPDAIATRFVGDAIQLREEVRAAQR